MILKAMRTGFIIGCIIGTISWWTGDQSQNIAQQILSCGVVCAFIAIPIRKWIFSHLGE